MTDKYSLYRRIPTTEVCFSSFSSLCAFRKLHESSFLSFQNLPFPAFAAPAVIHIPPLDCFAFLGISRPFSHSRLVFHMLSPKRSPAGLRCWNAKFCIIQSTLYDMNRDRMFSTYIGFGKMPVRCAKLSEKCPFPDRKNRGSYFLFLPWMHRRNDSCI